MAHLDPRSRRQAGGFLNRGPRVWRSKREARLAPCSRHGQSASFQQRFKVRAGCELEQHSGAKLDRRSGACTAEGDPVLGAGEAGRSCRAGRLVGANRRLSEVNQGRLGRKGQDSDRQREEETGQP